MAAPVALAFRVAANLAEFKANMAEMKAQLETTKGALKSVSGSFDGSKLIAQANAMMIAVRDVGGAANLTEAEQRRVNKTLDDAILKYRQLGREAPPDMLKLRDATNQVEKSTGGMSGALGKANGLLGAFGLALSVGAVVSFTKSVFDTGGNIADLSQKLGISTDAVQGFKFAAEQSGATLDTVGTAINKMNANLAGGDKATVQALKDAGLRFSDIRNLKPEDAFLAIADSIAKIEDPMTQADIAMQLFGKGGAELLPAIKNNFRETADAAAKMSADTVAALDAAGDAWGRLADWVVIKSGTIIAHSMNAAQGITGSWRQFGQFVENSLKFGVGAAAAMADAQQQVITAVAQGTEAQKQQAPAIRKTADELRQATKDSEAFAKAQDVLFGRDLIGKAQAYIAQLGPLDNLSRLSTEKQRELNKAAWDAIAVYSRLGQIAPKAMLDLYEATWKVANQIPLAVRATKEWAEQGIDQLARGLPLIKDNTRLVSAAVNALTDDFWQGNLATIDAKFRLDEWGKSLKNSTKAVQTLGESLLSTLKTIPQTLADAFTGGGGIMGGIAAIASKIGSQIGSAIGLAIGGPMGASIGAALGSMAGSLTKYLKPVYDGLTNLSTTWKTVLSVLVPPIGLLSWFSSAEKKVNDLRDTFLLTFGGAGTGAGSGFGTLAAQLHEIGAAGDAMFQRLIHATKTSDFEAAVKAINAALDAQKTKMSEVAAAAAASAAEQQAAIDEITGRYQTQIDDIQNRWNSLNKSVSAEAEEAVMGVIETQQRAEMARLEAEKVAKEIERDAEIAAKQETFDAMLEAGKAVDQQLRDVFANPHDFPIRWTFPDGMPAYGGAQAGGSDYLVTRPTVFLAGERGVGRTFSGGGRAEPAPRGTVTVRQPVQLVLDRKILTEVMAETVLT